MLTQKLAPKDCRCQNTGVRPGCLSLSLSLSLSLFFVCVCVCVCVCVYVCANCQWPRNGGVFNAISYRLRQFLDSIIRASFDAGQA